MTEDEVKQIVNESILLHRVLNLKRDIEMLRNDFLAEQGIIAPVTQIQTGLQDLIMLLPSVRIAEEIAAGKTRIEIDAIRIEKANG